MVLKLLLNIQIIWMMFIKILKNTIQNKNTKSKKRKILIVFDDVIFNMLSNKKLIALVIELFIRSRKLNISLIVLYQKY